MTVWYNTPTHLGNKFQSRAYQMYNKLVAMCYNLYKFRTFSRTFSQVLYTNISQLSLKLIQTSCLWEFYVADMTTNTVDSGQLQLPLSKLW